MFYRRKIILSLLQLCEGTSGKMKLQKLLFLYCKRKDNPEYDFIPYKYGCYSFSASADLSTMVKKGHLTENNKSYTKIDNYNYLEIIDIKDKKILNDVVSRFGKMSYQQLITHTYQNYPYYAIKSEIAEDRLTKKSYKKVLNAIPKKNSKTLFTIGYEGISLESYLNKLLQNNIKLLVDVRKNALSMKYGFSKTLLNRYCKNLGINYVHIPDVGIESSKRQSLESQDDYDKLFNHYKAKTLNKNVESQKEILGLLAKYKRIALTCFEANICQCHRLHLADSLKQHESELAIKHI